MTNEERQHIRAAAMEEAGRWHDEHGLKARTKAYDAEPESAARETMLDVCMTHEYAASELRSLAPLPPGFVVLPVAVVEQVKAALTGLLALYETDEGTRSLAEYTASHAALTALSEVGTK